jgi:hypothetical protein
MAEIFRFLVESNLVTTVFVIGSIVFFLAVIGSIKTYVELSTVTRILLALCGVFFMVLSFGSYLFGRQITNDANTPAPSVVQETPVPLLPASTAMFLQELDCNGWCVEIGKVPENGTRISVDIVAGQMVFLSGGQLLINDKYCGGDARQICILIFEASKLQTVVVDALIPGNNYVGITDTYTPEQALSIKTPAFWKSPNCINGCGKATVLFFRDGEFIKQETRLP